MKKKKIELSPEEELEVIKTRAINYIDFLEDKTIDKANIDTVFVIKQILGWGGR